MYHVGIADESPKGSAGQQKALHWQTSAVRLAATPSKTCGFQPESSDWRRLRPGRSFAQRRKVELAESESGPQRMVTTANPPEGPTREFDQRAEHVMVADTVRLGKDVSIPQPQLVNLYGCSIGDGSKVGAFVEIQRGAAVGRHCTISSHSFICEGVTIEDGVFIGHGVMFTNDLVPARRRARPSTAGRRRLARRGYAHQGRRVDRNERNDLGRRDDWRGRHRRRGCRGDQGCPAVCHCRRRPGTGGTACDAAPSGGRLRMKVPA